MKIKTLPKNYVVVLPPVLSPAEVREAKMAEIEAAEAKRRELERRWYNGDPAVERIYLRDAKSGDMKMSLVQACPKRRKRQNTARLGACTPQFEYKEVIA